MLHEAVVRASSLHVSRFMAPERVQEEPAPPPRPLPQGFTLLEVVLALSIAIALLVVVLYYYQQAARLRDSTLTATAGLAAVRLCMDRLGTELRTASTQPGTFRGGPQELEFLLCDLPEPSTDTPGEAAIETFMPLPSPAHPLRPAHCGRPDRNVRFGANRGRPGHARVNRNRIGRSFRLRPPTTPDAPTVPAVQLTPAVEESVEPTAPPDTSTLGQEVEAVSPANSPAEEGTRLTTAFPGSGTLALAIPEVRFLRLRYHDGTAWLDAWSASTLPRGVEITLALEPAAPDAGPDALPGEVFRRTIALTTSPARAPEAPRATGFTDPWDPTEDGL
ncbi:MAG: hypothetical protein M5U12_32025 [Verrucomicrobia bacterium]|nr:hypothetical protein [Verrucomicrobiota bacterium]